MQRKDKHPRTSPQLLFLLLLVLLNSCMGDRGSADEIDLTPNFSASSKLPLGLYVAHELTKLSFSSLPLKFNSQQFPKFREKQAEDYDHYAGQHVYLVVGRQFLPGTKEINAMSEFVKKGNTLMIVANRFDQEFLDHFFLLANDLPSLDYQSAYGMPMMDTYVSMSDTAAFGSGRFGFFFYPLAGSIRRDSLHPSERIARAEFGVPGAVVFRHGRGRMILSMNATALTNYFLLTKENHKFLEQLFAYIPEDAHDITWDTYYNRVQTKSEGGSSYSDFQELMKHPPLKWATWLFVLGGILLILMAMIRRQRMIPVIKPNVNSSVEFAETVARLYLLKKDNKNIAQKMITFFLEKVRARYYVNTSTLNQDFIEAVAAKSGQPVTAIQSLVATIDQVQVQDTVSDELLLGLNKKIDAVLAAS